jgi:RNA-binding protein
VECSRVPTGTGRLECQPLPAYVYQSISHPRTGRAVIDYLTPGRRAELRSQAHSLKPIFQVGKEGVTDRAIDAVRDAFNTREILKIKVLDSAPTDARATGEALASGIEDAHVVQVIGRTVVLYRPEPEDRVG